MPASIDLTGQKFNRLLALRPTLGHKLGTPKKYDFLCDCGKVKSIVGSSVKFGTTKSCGCLKVLNGGKTNTQKALARPPGEAGLDLMMSDLKYQAKARHIEFHLEKELVRVVSKQNCHYCDDPPSQVYEVSRAKWGKASTQLHGRWIANNLDRKDPNKGYMSDNVVACCSRCNFSKHTMSYEAFIQWVKKVHKHFVER